MATRTPTSKERLYTLEEFEQMPEFDERYELIDGRLVKKPVPGMRHGLIAGRIRDAFNKFDWQLPQSRGIMLQEVNVKLGPGNSPLPDLSFWKAERNIAITDGAGPRPDLAVEVHSPGDLRSPSALASAMGKVKKLLDANVPILWVIYPNRQEVEVYYANPGFNAGPVERLGIGKDLSGENVIPGFKLPVAELFE